MASVRHHDAFKGVLYLTFPEDASLVHLWQECFLFLSALRDGRTRCTSLSIQQEPKAP
jgi:hypothetical protein